MAELLRLLDITGLRPQVLIGKEIHTDFLSQVRTLLITLSASISLGRIRTRFLTGLKLAPTTS